MYTQYVVAVRSTAPPDPEVYKQRRDAIRRARALAEQHRGHVVEVEERGGWKDGPWIVYRAEWCEYPPGYIGYGWRRGEVLGRELIERAP